jgi:hypothetical protein
VLVEDADEENYRNDISDKMSVYSQEVINNETSGKNTDSMKTTRTANLSVFSAKMRNRNISVQDIQSSNEVSKI